MYALSPKWSSLVNRKCNFTLTMFATTSGNYLKNSHSIRLNKNERYIYIHKINNSKTKGIIIILPNASH